MRENTKIISVGALLTALSLIVISMTALLQTMQYTLVALAGILPTVMVIRFKPATGLYVYIGVLVLGFILLPDKEAMLLYGLLFGHYPMTKWLIEQIKKVPVQWIIKIVVCNVLFVAVYYLSIALFAADVSLENVPLWLFWLLANVTFVFYDICFSKIIAVVVPRIYKIIK